MSAEWNEIALESASPIVVAIDCILVAAIVAAYWLQLRHLWKLTTDEIPSTDGLSSLYVFLHGISCNFQLSFAFLTLWNIESDRYSKLSAFDSRVLCAQIFVQWLCAMLLIIVYVYGRSKAVSGKSFIPATVLIHAMIFVYGGWNLQDPRGLGDGIAVGVVAFIIMLSMPLTTILQACAQYWELRSMKCFGALSLRSFIMQAVVMAAIGVRHHIISWIRFPGWSNDADNFILMCLGNLSGAYYWFFMSISYLLWAASAVVVYLWTRSNKKESDDNNVLLAVYKD